MLARWFDRSGIGQYLAPDENAAKVRPVTENDEGRAPLWQLLAPDPNFVSKQPPPVGAFPPHLQQQQDGQTKQVLCEHCNQWTRVGPGTPSTTTTTTTTTSNTNGVNQTTPQRQQTPNDLFKTPSPQDGTTTTTASAAVVDPITADLHARVLSAAKNTALSFTSPKKFTEGRDQVFRICSNPNPINTKIAKRLRKALTNDPALLTARSVRLGVSCPDGYTPFHAACMANQLEAINIILDVAKEIGEPPIHELLLDRDYQGRCALTIASEAGHTDIVQHLLPLYVKEVPSTTRRRRRMVVMMLLWSVLPSTYLVGHRWVVL